MRLKYLKLFEELTISKWDFPEYGQPLSKRERSLLNNVLYDSYIKIIKDDGYYYVNNNSLYNRFENFYDLMDYLKICYYKKRDNIDEIINILDRTNLDLNFDKGDLLNWASNDDKKIKLVKILIKEFKLNPTDNDNDAILTSIEYGALEILKLFTKDPRVVPRKIKIDGYSYGDNGFHRNIRIYQNIIKNNNIEFLSFLMKKFKIDWDLSMKYAIIYNKMDVVKFLLNNSKDKLSTLTPNSQTIHELKRCGNNIDIMHKYVRDRMDIIMVLLSYEQIVDLLSYRINRCKFIKMACRHGYIETAKNLINKYKSSPRDYFKYSINWAIKNGHYEIANLLLNNDKIKGWLSPIEMIKYKKIIGNE